MTHPTNKFGRRRALLVVVLALAALAAFAAAVSAGYATPSSVARPAAAQYGNHDTYTWIVGATTPSDTAIAPDGSTITMTGSGSLTAGPGKTATGGGTYSLSSDGSGTWTVTGVQGFVSYGSAGPDFPPGFTGGEAKLNVTLSNGSSGVLTIICALGSFPASKEEGITVILGKGGQFTKQDGGNNIFILS